VKGKRECVFGQFLKYYMKILLAGFSAKVGREGIFKPTVMNENLHEVSNDNGFTVVNFAVSKNLIVRHTIFPHCNIHKYAWNFPSGKVHSQFNHVLSDKRQHSNVVNV